MVSNLQDTINALFPPQGSRIGNIKFFRGENRDVTAHQLVAQFCIAERQVADGKAVKIVDVDAIDVD